MKTALLMSISLLALAGCHQAPQPGQAAAGGSGTQAGPAPAAVTASAAMTPTGPVTNDGAAFPAPRAGLWVVAMTTSPARSGADASGGRGPVRACSDGTTPQQMGMRGMQGCDVRVAHGPGGSLVFSSDCHLGPDISVSSRGIAVGDFSSTYRVHMESDTQGAQVAEINGHRTTDITGTYAGACPANMPPGSVEIAGHVFAQPGAGGRPAG